MNTRKRLVAFVAAALMISSLGAGTALANLPGSTFEGNDGNLIVNTTGNTDWATANLPGFHADQDLATGQNDNSFGGGSKENDLNVNVVTGSIPNSKADLGRFAVASETAANDHVYLYMAWTRETQSGTTNFDFEINQAAQPDLTTVGAKTLVRTVGDLLITYDFQGGSQNPTIGARRWNGSSWAVVVLGAQSTEAEVNRAPVAETLLSPTIQRPSFQFGEAAIDLTAAGLLPGGGEGGCAGFSSIYVKSRSSDAFTSAMKDFIAPIPVDLNTCGAIAISKTAKHANSETGSIPFEGVEFELDGESIGTTDENGELCVSGLSQGTYTLHEVVPDGYAAVDDIEVTVDAISTCDSGAEEVDIDNTPLTDVTISVDSQVAGGTDSQVDCDVDALDFDTADATGDGTATATDLEPVVINCTITIDP